ncbi:calmodulin-2-like [Chrysoperla carnea]|uniref:calmodulin-2-like n=1 Tax=Chrysoperla carnea TaxID=189513 RepID=UPI001D09567C|nr:calmodulin-2-like [Chrysoperla carnea]
MSGEEEGFVIDIEINNELDQKIVDQFALFDELDAKKIDSDNVGTFLRSLGLYVTNADVEEIKEKSFHSQIPNAYHIGLLLPNITECFLKHKFLPKTVEQLFEAFHLLDPDKKGSLDIAYVEDVFKNQGDQFDDKEMAEFMVRAVDHRSQKVNYEYLINALLQNVLDENDLFKLSDKIALEPPQEKVEEIIAETLKDEGEKDEENSLNRNLN